MHRLWLGCTMGQEMFGSLALTNVMKAINVSSIAMQLNRTAAAPQI